MSDTTKRNKIQFSLRMDDDILRAVDKYAAQNRITRSAAINQIVARFFEKKEKDKLK